MKEKKKLVLIIILIVIALLLGAGGFFFGRAVSEKEYNAERELNIKLNRSKLDGLGEIEGSLRAAFPDAVFDGTSFRIEPGVSRRKVMVPAITDVLEAYPKD